MAVHARADRLRRAHLGGPRAIAGAHPRRQQLHPRLPHPPRPPRVVPLAQHLRDAGPACAGDPGRTAVGPLAGLPPAKRLPHHPAVHGAGRAQRQRGRRQDLDRPRRPLPQLGHLPHLRRGRHLPLRSRLQRGRAVRRAGDDVDEPQTGAVRCRGLRVGHRRAGDGLPADALAQRRHRRVAGRQPGPAGAADARAEARGPRSPRHRPLAAPRAPRRPRPARRRS